MWLETLASLDIQGVTLFFPLQRTEINTWPKAFSKVLKSHPFILLSSLSTHHSLRWKYGHFPPLLVKELFYRKRDYVHWPIRKKPPVFECVDVLVLSCAQEEERRGDAHHSPGPPLSPFGAVRNPVKCQEIKSNSIVAIFTICPKLWGICWEWSLALDSLSQNRTKFIRKKKRLVFSHVLNVLMRFGVGLSCKVLKSWTDYL